MKTLWRRLKWYERMKEGDEFLNVIEKEWIPVFCLAGFFVWKRIVLRSKGNYEN